MGQIHPLHFPGHSVQIKGNRKEPTVSNNTVNVKAIRKAAVTVKRLAYVIAAIGATTSFGTQVNLLESWHMSRVFAVGVAATVDLLAICAAIALAIPGFPVRDRKIVGTILVIALGASIGANVTAGLAESVGAAIGHSWPVLAYMGAELIAQRIRNYLDAVEAADAKANAPAPVVTLPVAEAAVKVARATRPVIARAHAAGVAKGTHAGHDHPATPAARAACRKAAMAA
jgi:hypothetical protein